MAHRKKVPDMVGSSDEEEKAGVPRSQPRRKAERSHKKRMSNREAETEWYKLSKEDKEPHQRVIKLYVMSPWLFNGVKSREKWMGYAKDVGLLKKSSHIDTIGLTDEEMTNVDIIERAIEAVFRLIQYGEVCLFLNSLDAMDEKRSVPEIIKDARLFNFIMAKYVREYCKKIPDGVTPNEKEVMATVFACMQYHDYIFDFIKRKKDLLGEFKKTFAENEKSIEKEKAKGNEEFKNGNYFKSITNYTAAINISPYSHALYGNRALAHLKVERYKEALADCRRAIVLKPDWAKAYYRQAQALYQLGRIPEAFEVNSFAQWKCEKDPDVSELKSQEKKLKEAKKTMEERKKAGLNQPKKHVVYISGLPKDTTVEEMNDFFGGNGIYEIASIDGTNPDIILRLDEGEACIGFKTDEGVKSCIRRFNGHTFHGNELSIKSTTTTPMKWEK